MKAIINFEKVHLAKGLNYLTDYDLKVELLINFGAIKPEFK